MAESPNIYETIPPSYQSSLIPFTRQLADVPDTETQVTKQLDQIIGPTLPALHRGIFKASKNQGILSHLIVKWYYLLESSTIALCKRVEALILQTWKLGCNSSTFAEQFVLGFDLCFAKLPFTGNMIIEDYELRILKDLFVDLFSHKKIIDISMGRCHRLIVEKKRYNFQDHIAVKLKAKYGFDISCETDVFSSSLFTLTLLIYIEKMKPCKVLQTIQRKSSESKFRGYVLDKVKEKLSLHKPNLS
ncbi:hypothetical protein Cantr_03235 [Candida viswanathii]|uniref:Uncharacterized protein n=1 Tax=Candida viswanathii TaxID=5486 RepID=A0A367YPB3_9ASCO|nr:hypothetical protein Cantr_03235 [Candida viswanathii]